MQVYLMTKPKNKIEKDYLAKLVERIEANSFDVYWPEKDNDGNSKKRLAETREKITGASIALVVHTGHSFSQEELFALGQAWQAKNISQPEKLIVGLNMAQKEEYNINKEVREAIDIIVKTEYDLIDCMKSYMKTFSK